MRRRDNKISNKALGNTSILAPTSNGPTLIQKFQNAGLTKEDIVTLLGIGDILRMIDLLWSCEQSIPNTCKRISFVIGEFKLVHQYAISLINM